MKASDETTSHDLGNTVGTKSCLKLKKLRNWHFVLNPESMKHYEEIEKYLLNLKLLQYYLSVSHDNRPHYHIFIQMKDSYKPSLKKLFGAHIVNLESHDQKLKGTPQQNKEYLLCQDKKHIKLGIKCTVIKEYGELKEHGGSKVKYLMELNDDEERELPANLYLQCEKIKQIEQRKQETEDYIQMLINRYEKDIRIKPKVVYISGLPGLGKTDFGYKLLFDTVGPREMSGIDYDGQFFNFENEKANEGFIFPDFRASLMKASMFLRLIDEYGFRCNIKGSYKIINPKIWVICYYNPPTEIYKNENNQQFLRRIDEIYDFQEEKTPILIYKKDVNTIEDIREYYKDKIYDLTY